MVKKLNELGVTIKKLLAKGYSQILVARKLGDKYIKEIIALAENKTTSSMSSNRIANIINKKLKEDGLNLSITKMTVCRILKQEYGKPRKIKKVFYLSKKIK